MLRVKIRSLTSSGQTVVPGETVITGFLLVSTETVLISEEKEQGTPFKVLVASLLIFVLLVFIFSGVVETSKAIAVAPGTSRQPIATSVKNCH